MLRKRLVALATALTVLTLALISVLPAFVSAEVDGGTTKAHTYNSEISRSGANVVDLSLSEFGLAETDIINKIEVDVTDLADEGYHKYQGVLGITPKTTYNGETKDGWISKDFNDDQAANTYTLVFELSEEQANGALTSGQIHLGCWWSGSPTMNIGEVRLTINGTYEEDGTDTDGSDYDTVLQGGTEKTATVGDKTLNYSTSATVEIPLADLGILATDTINKVAVTLQSDNFAASPRYNGRLGLSALDPDAKDGLVATPQIDADQTANPFTLTFELSKEESADVNVDGVLHLDFYWSQSGATNLTIQTVKFLVNGQYVDVPKEPVDPPVVDTSKYLDYATALQASLYLYDANYCGPLAGEYSALTWRDDCHTKDIFDITVDGVTYKNVDLTGGFHDAGDHVKFGLPAAYSAFTLGLAYNQFPAAFDTTAQTYHLQSITEYFADYFKKSIIRDNSGKVVAFVYQVGTGGPDHDYWGAPEKQANDSGRVAYISTSKNINADIIGGTIAALAINYINFGNKDDLKAAQDLYEYLHSFYDVILADTSDDTDDLEVVSKVAEYSRWEDAANQNSPWDYISLAAITLKLATNSNSYDDFNDPKGIAPNKSYFPANWDGVWPYYHVLAGATNVIATNDLNACGVGKEYTTQYDFIQKWGSARLNANLQFTALMYDKATATDTYKEWARGQMDYLFGKNDDKQAFIVGYNFRNDVKYPLYPHHRASDGGTKSPGSWNENWYDILPDGTWAKKDSITYVTKAQKNVLIGALVGGPEHASGAYADSLNNYVGNEVAIDYQAGFIGALAGLFLAYQNNGTDTIIKSASQLAKGVDSDYFTGAPVDRTPKPPKAPDNGGSTDGGTTGNIDNSTNPSTGDSGSVLPVVISIFFASVAVLTFRKKRAGQTE
ncbi:hypothetical protein FACS1894132_06520 [Clostridia bacterium]|nr:hypothetical protein FACS1894132_06520 [Clostridia bacterium]